MSRDPSASTFVAIDFELANWQSWSACAVGVVRVERGRLVRRASRLIRPPTTWFQFSDTHRITRADVMRAPGFAEVWADLAPVLRGCDYLVAHNAPFDQRVLRACANRFGGRVPKVAFRCSMALARRRWRLPSVALPRVAEHLGIALQHHDALSDAEACARIVLAAGPKCWSGVSV